MPNRTRPTRYPGDALAVAIHAHLAGDPVDWQAALDGYHRRTQYRDRIRRQQRAAGTPGQTCLGWTVAELAARTGVERVAALRLVRSLVTSGRVVRIARGRFLDATAPRRPARRTRITTLRLGAAIDQQACA